MVKGLALGRFDRLVAEVDLDVSVQVALGLETRANEGGVEAELGAKDVFVGREGELGAGAARAAIPARIARVGERPGRPARRGGVRPRSRLTRRDTDHVRRRAGRDPGLFRAALCASQQGLESQPRPQH